METVYVVEYSVHNSTSDAWAHNVSGSNTDLNTAKRTFHSECNRLFGSDEFDYVAVILRTMDGNPIMRDYKNTYVVPEE